MSWKLIGIVLVQIFMFHVSSYSARGPHYSFIREASSGPSMLHFDYIVIGGGTSGCPLAATLSRRATVLVLERGGSPYGNPNITNIDSFVASLSDASPDSPSQQFTSEDGVYNTRARVLGGGSALNAGFYSRASATYVNDAGWDERLVNASYEWVERRVAFRPPMLEWQSAVRNGLIEAGVLPDNGFTYDHLYGTKVGGTIFDTKGHRHTAADLFEYAEPRNIRVYLHATVLRILFTHRGSPWLKPRAYGVIFEDAVGFRYTAILNRGSRNEIIVSAGAIGSPQILMLSGIGPARHLLSHGIPVVLDKPMVGEGMADNPMNLLVIPSPLPVEVSLIEVVGITESGSFIETASGLTYTYNWAQRFIGDYEQSLNQTSEPNMLSREAMARAVETMNSLVNATLRGGVILAKIKGPLSRGNLRLRTTDPDDNPSVRFNYFQDPEDLRLCVEGMRTIIAVINSQAFSRFRYDYVPVQSLISLMADLPVNLRPRHANTAFSLEQFCIDTVMTIWHYHGGCQVGRVVDQDYKVTGVDALRVVDGSTFLRSPGTNPQATVMMLGRYMGKRILRERFSRRRRRE
ncbi:protein HOTHEAD [Mercurialis annua]|uniref:protein HOTHEAD n=1 Tax=Mercurialis annua TaxID=3986 RepID=UPI00215E5892|nr:protein HOTHEAD [Mercurialis annua]